MKFIHSLSYLLIISIVVALAGCAATAQQTLSAGSSRTIPEELYCEVNSAGGNDESLENSYQDHVLVVDRKGGYDKFLEIDINGVSFYHASDTFRNQFIKIVDAQTKYREKKEKNGELEAAKRILLFVNGGLVGRSASLRLANQQVECIKKAGYFPIFLIWRSSGFESYWEQISQVRDGFLRENVRLTTPLYFLADIGQGFARTPATWTSQLGRWVSGMREFMDNTPVILDPGGLRVQYRGPDQEETDFQLDSLLAVLSSPVKMLTTPFVDGIGKTAWENMVRRTRTTLHRAAEFEPHHAKDPNELKKDLVRYPRGTGAFAKFFAELEACIFPAGGYRPSTIPQRICTEDKIGSSMQNIEITAIGHSMGTIVLNESIRNFPSLPYRNIVYMASAASIRETLISIIPQLRRDIAKERTAQGNGQSHTPLRFYNLMLHPVAEKHESAAFNLAPDGTLLAWIDDMYESSPSVIDRTMGRWRNIEKTAHLIPKYVKPRMFFKIFGFRKPSGDREPGDPTLHGSFNDTSMHYWLEDYWWSE